MASPLRYSTVLLLLTLGSRLYAADVDPAGLEFFEKKIRPVLVEQCYKCHSADAQTNKKLRGGLLLDSRQGGLKGGDTGPSIVPGKSKESLLLKALKHEGELRMPPKGRLPESVLADFARWIDMGALDPRDGKTELVKSGLNLAEGRQFWSFQPLKHASLPKVKDAAWPKSGIDHFILAKLEEKNLRPVPAADKRNLLRRAYFDLIGLPPAPEEVATFLEDDSPTAFAKVIDRLLASPQYGERWGRYWLDVARYAEDQAHTFGVQPNTNAWRYRDWVVAAFNEDMPYDRFVRLQIAADLIETDEASRVKHLPALGFFGLGAQYYKNSDAAKVTADELDDRVDTLTRGFMGLTVSCARCHDHKFDPVPQQDYYSLAGIFQSCRLANVTLAPKEKEKIFQDHQQKINKVSEKIKATTRDEATKLAEQHAGEIARYLTAAWRHQVRNQKEPKWSVNEQAKQEKLSGGTLGRFVDFLKKSPPGLEAWSKLPADGEEKAIALAAVYQKRVEDALAKRAKSSDKGAGEILQRLFGEKGVFTPSDGDVNAKMPAQLKEQLAKMKAELDRLQKDDAAKPLPIAHGLVEATPGDMKIYVRGNPANQGEPAPRRFLQVIAGDSPAPFKQGSGRLELASAVASKDNPLTARVIVNRIWQHHFGRGLVKTPSNFGKMGEPPSHPELLDHLAERLIAAGWSLKALHREIMLSAVYQLGTDSDEKNMATDADNRYLWHMSRRRLDVEVWRDSMLAVAGKLDLAMGGPTLDLANSNNFRRTIYAKVSRHDLNPLLRLFDFPDANITSERRTETTVPQQQLFVINSAFVVDTAKALASRLQKEATDQEQRVQRAFLLVYGRPVQPQELRLALAFLAGNDHPDEQAANRLTRWERLAQVLLGSNEFLYID